ncbi:MAG: phage resistance protein, partial [Acidobacteria bacterium ACB2]|nr:phage resistance protein [Acidobacteria bacterium ACB2]
KRFLLVPYHMIGAKSLESRILGEYSRQVLQAHPGAPAPGVYLSEGLVENARRLRGSMGDAAFFGLLNAGASADSDWGELAAGWDAASFEAAATAPPDSDERARLVGDLVSTALTAIPGAAAATGEGFVDLDLGLSLVSKHAAALGYDGVVLFLDELILWLASHIGDLRFAETEGVKLLKLVEAGPYERPVPIVSFVARQRDLKDLVGAHVPGAERLSFADALRHINDRFGLVKLEDRNLPAIVQKRLLGPRDEASRVRIDDAFRETDRLRDDVRGALLGSTGDRDRFRQVYPFSPALVDTLVAVSGMLQRERTALKLLLQLLVNRRGTLELGQVVAVGELFDVLAAGAEPFSADMKAHFDEAVRLYRQRLLPAVAREHGLTPEEAEALAWDHPKARLFRGDDRIVKTLLLSALAPEVPALRDLTPAKLCALNHGSIRAPVEGHEATLLLGKLRKWAAEVGALRLSADAAQPTVSIQLSRVDVDALLEREAAEDNTGNRRRKLQEILFDRLGVKSVDGLFVEHEVVWRGTRRTVEVVFSNVREMPDDSLRVKGASWRLLLDFPFDPEGGALGDDLRRIEEFRSRNEPSSVLCWLPAFLTAGAQRDLGRLVVTDHLLAGERFARATQHLSEVDRASARSELESLQSQLKNRLALDLEMAYGVRTDLDPSRVESGHDPSDHVRSLHPAFEPRPPVGASLKDALANLLDQLFTSLYPTHPRFEKEVRPAQVKQAFEQLREAAGNRDGRLDPVPAPHRETLRSVAMPLGLGRMYDSHFILERDWVTRFERALGEPGAPPTVRTLREAIDRPSPMGLPVELSDLVILTFAEQAQRSFVLQGAPYAPGIGALRDEAELREQPLPPEDVWATAVERAGAIFGVVVPKYRTAANAAALAQGVKKEVQARLEAVLKLPGDLERPIVSLGQPASGERLVTARAAATLLKDLSAAPAEGVARVLGLATLPGTAQSLGKSIGSAQGVREALERTKWQLFSGLPDLPDSRGEAGKAVVARVVEALRKDELAQALSPVLLAAEDEALRLVLPPSPTPPPPPPTPPPPGRRVTVDRGESADVPLGEARKVTKKIEDHLQANPDDRVTITWEITRKA